MFPLQALNQIGSPSYFYIVMDIGHFINVLSQKLFCLKKKHQSNSKRQLNAYSKSWQ